MNPDWDDQVLFRRPPRPGKPSLILVFHAQINYICVDSSAPDVMTSPSDFSDYVIFVDESGDHGLISVDPYYPIFVLVFCIAKKVDYIKQITPSLQALKFKH